MQENKVCQVLCKPQHAVKVTEIKQAKINQIYRSNEGNNKCIQKLVKIFLENDHSEHRVRSGAILCLFTLFKDSTNL